MRAILLFAVAALACLASTSAHDMIAGTDAGARWKYTKIIYLNAIPYVTLKTEQNFSFPGTRFIEGIFCHDVDNSEAYATITRGGVGFINVRIRFVSGNGKRLYYICNLYSKSLFDVDSRVSNNDEITYMLDRE